LKSEIELDPPGSGIRTIVLETQHLYCVSRYAEPRSGLAVSNPRGSAYSIDNNQFEV
jgi:hypothetical protein